MNRLAAENDHDRRRESSRSEGVRRSSERGSSQAARSRLAAEDVGSGDGKADQSQNDAILTETSAEIRIEVKEVREKSV